MANNEDGFIEFRAHGNKKQVEAFKYWMDKTTFHIVYGGSKACLVFDQLIKTNCGRKRICDIEIGDIVLTTNEENGSQQWKPVLKVFKYHHGGSNDYHKIIKFVMKSGHILALTPNHEIYVDGNWVPAGELARRTLGLHRWNRRSISDFNSREGAVSPDLWTEKVHFFKTLSIPEGTFKNSPSISKGDDVNASSSISCFAFHRESFKQAVSEPHRLQSGKQPHKQSGVGHGQRECASLETQMPPALWGQEGSQEQQDNSYRRASIGDTSQVQEENCHKRDVGRGIWGHAGNNQRCDFAQELDPYLVEEIRFELQQGYVYDLHVADNHNYVATEDDLIIHNSGKSFLGCSLIMADAIMYPGTHYFIARKTLADLRKHTTTSIAQVLNGWGISPKDYRYNGQDNFYQFKNGSKVYLFGCEPRPSDPLYGRLGSIQMTRGWCEESSEIEEAAKNALSATIGRWKNEEYGLTKKLLMTCNPDKGWLYSDYYEPWKNKVLQKDRKFIQALPTDNKMLDEGYLEGLEQSLNYNERQRLLHGNWEYDDDPSVLIDYDAILDVFRNFSVPHGKPYITVDVARMGGARIVCIEWDGYRGHVRSWDKQEFPETLRRIEESRMKLGISPKDVLIDGDGMGPGVGDWGKYSQFRNNFPALPSKDKRKRRDSNGNIVKENFDNRKSQMGFYMADMVNERRIFLTCEHEDDKTRIRQELEQVRKKRLDSDMKNALVSKEEVTKRLRRSPDFWDAILMRHFFEYMGQIIKITPRNGNDKRIYPGLPDRRRWERPEYN